MIWKIATGLLVVLNVVMAWTMLDEHGQLMSSITEGEGRSGHYAIIASSACSRLQQLGYESRDICTESGYGVPYASNP